MHSRCGDMHGVTLVLAVVLAVVSSQQWDVTPGSLPVQGPNIEAVNGTIYLGGSDVIYALNNGTVALNGSTLDLAEEIGSHDAAIGAINTRIVDTYATLKSNYINSLTTVSNDLSSSIASTVSAQIAATNELSTSIVMTQASNQVQADTLQLSINSNAAAILAATQSAAEIVTSLSAAASVSVSISAAVVTQTDSLSASIVTSQGNLQAQITQNANNILSLSAAAIQSQASIASVSQAVVNAQIATMNTDSNLNLLSVTANQISASVVANRNNLQSQINQLALNGSMWSTAIVAATVSAANIASSVTIVTSALNSLSATVATLSAGTVSFQTNLQNQINQLSINVSGTNNMIIQASLSTQSVSAAIITATANAVGLSTAVASGAVITSQVSSSVSAANAIFQAQISTMAANISAQLSTKVASSALLSIFNTGLFAFQSSVPYPSTLGIPNYVLWLDAMLPDCINFADATTLNSVDGTLNYQFKWIGTGGNPVLRNGAWHIFGQGYYSQPGGCPGFPTGTTGRTLLFWARPFPSNIYIKHVFHYGSANVPNAFGVGHWVSSSTNQIMSTGSLAFHQWGYVGTSTQGTWLYGEAAMFAVTFTGSVYQWSKNGSPLVTVTPSVIPSTTITAASGYCNLGARVSGSEYFTGPISSVYMYSRVLSQGEINTIYQATLRTF